MPDFTFNCPDCGEVPSQPWRQIAATDFVDKCPRCGQTFVIHVEFYKVVEGVTINGVTRPDEVQVLIEDGRTA